MRFALLLLLTAACSGNNGNGTTNGATNGGTNGSTGGTNGSTGGTTGSTTGGTTGNMTGTPLTVSIGPFTLNTGEEIVKCAVVKLPTAVDVDVVNIKATLLPGSHHLIAYRTDATAEKAPYDCTSFEGVFGGDAPVFIAESAAAEMQLPSGAAYHFKANQYILLEAHYINTTQAPITAKGTFVFTPGAGSVSYMPADIMMCGSYLSLDCNLGGGIPAGQADHALPVGFYNGKGTGISPVNVDLKPLKFFAFTSHQHRRGINVNIWKSTSTNVSQAQLLYENDSWSNPPLTVLDDSNLLTFGPNEGFAWQCHYDTSADANKVCFGESANDEMCFIWAYYYPSVGRFISTNDCWAW